MVTCLLTITIKVNNDPSCRIAVDNGVMTMKKVKTGRSFWDWLMGSGWDSAGGNG